MRPTHATTDASCTRDAQEAKALGEGWAGFPPAPTELWGHTTLSLPRPPPSRGTGLAHGDGVTHKADSAGGRRDANFSCREIQSGNQPGRSHSTCKMWANLDTWILKPMFTPLFKLRGGPLNDQCKAFITYVSVQYIFYKIYLYQYKSFPLDKNKQQDKEPIFLLNTLKASGWRGKIKTVYQKVHSFSLKSS